MKLSQVYFSMIIAPEQREQAAFAATGVPIIPQRRNNPYHPTSKGCSRDQGQRWMHAMSITPEQLAPSHETVATEPTLLTPIDPHERIASIDVLRGVALCGILTINIWFFALPEVVSSDPSRYGGWDAANQTVWMVVHLLCEQKMMSIFSMLFGAGLIVMDRRSAARGRSFIGIYYRRTFWLLLFGLAHAYLLWMGDILVAYALCGFVLYPFRRLRPLTQFLLGGLLFLSQVVLVSCIGLLILYVRGVTGPENKQGSPELRQARVALEESLVGQIGPDTAKSQIEDHQKGYIEQLPRRAGENIVMQTWVFLFWSGPRAGGLMLIGMGLMQLGVFSASRSFRFYARLALVGYGVGLPIVGFGILDTMSHFFDPVHQLLLGGHFNYIGSLFVALGHVGLVMLICKAERLRWLTYRLAALGRMALSNYFMQTILCTTLFEGWGWGLFGRLDRLQLLGVVVCVWLLQLIVSPIWLRFFRFGPMEWLWRCLTYWQLYPFRLRGQIA